MLFKQDSRVQEKVSFGCQGQVDFSAGKISFNSHLPDGPRQVVCQLQKKKKKEN